MSELRGPCPYEQIPVFIGGCQSGRERQTPSMGAMPDVTRTDSRPVQEGEK